MAIDAANAPAAIDTPRVAPVAGAERIAFIDTLRGFALLGILPMNIPWFALYTFTFFNPSLQGGFEGADFLAWLLGHVLFDFKMMTIFSALFGAGVVVFATRAELRAGRSAGLFYTRLFWLLLFGLIHAYAIWEGDILVTYAVCGAIVYLFRKRRPATLIILACALLLVGSLINFGTGVLFNTMRTAAQAVEAGDAQEWQQGFANAWAQTEPSFIPTQEQLDAQRAAFEGGYFDLLPQRAAAAVMFELFILPLWGIWRVVGVMLLGMAALKTGVLTAHRSRRFYLWTLALGYGAGVPLVGVGAALWINDGFDFVRWYTVTGHFNYVGSLFVAAGHVALVALVVRAGALAWLTRRLAAVGQMAFTNYIAHSVICAAIFYGYGFGLWGDVSRAALWGFVLVIWTAQLLWSPWWLARFRFGPLEWLWRTLTYLEPQPMRVRANAATPSA